MLALNFCKISNFNVYSNFSLIPDSSFVGKIINDNSDECAENFSWTRMKPMFRKHAELDSSPPLEPVRHHHRFNSVKITNETTLKLKPSELEYRKFNENFNKTINVLLETAASVSDKSDDNIIEITSPKEPQEDDNVVVAETIPVIEKNQIYSIVEILEPNSQLININICKNSDSGNKINVNNITIDSVRENINCDPLRDIFTQHECSTEKGQKQIRNEFIGINNEPFISSHFLKCDDDNSNIVTVDSFKDQQQQMEKTKLFEPSSILNEWLDQSSIDDTKNDIQTTSLSKSGKKVKEKEMLESCFR